MPVSRPVLRLASGLSPRLPEDEILEGGGEPLAAPKLPSAPTTPFEDLDDEGFITELQKRGDTPSPQAPQLSLGERALQGVSKYGEGLVEGVRNIPQSYQEIKQSPLGSVPFGIPQALAVLGAIPTLEPALEAAGVGEGPSIQTPLGKLTARGVASAVLDPLNLIPLGPAAKPLAKGAAKAAVKAGPRLAKLPASQAGKLSAEGSLPPVRKGFVRLYRGQEGLPNKYPPVPDSDLYDPQFPTSGPTEGRWFSTSRETAENLHANIYGEQGNLRYVDVPQAVANASKVTDEAFPAYAGGRSEFARLLPPEWARKATVIGGKETSQAGKMSAEALENLPGPQRSLVTSPLTKEIDPEDFTQFSSARFVLSDGSLVGTAGENVSHHQLLRRAIFPELAPEMELEEFLKTGAARISLQGGDLNIEVGGKLSAAQFRTLHRLAQQTSNGIVDVIDPSTGENVLSLQTRNAPLAVRRLQQHFNGELDEARAGANFLPSIEGGSQQASALARPLPVNDIMAARFNPTQARRLAQWMSAPGKSPVRGIQRLINPSALAETPLDRAAVVLEADGDFGRAATSSVMTRLGAQKSPFAIKGGRIQNVEGNPVYHSVLKDRTRTKFQLNPEQQARVAMLQEIMDDVELMKREFGFGDKLRKFGSGEGYWPQNVQAIKGVERSFTGPRRAIGAKQRFQQVRLHEAEEGIDLGIDYGNSPELDIELELDALYKVIRDQRFADAIKPLGRTVRASIPTTIRFRAIDRNLQASKRLVDAAQRTSRGERLPPGVIQALKNHFPDEAQLIENASKLHVSQRGYFSAETKKAMQGVIETGRQEIARLTPARRAASKARAHSLAQAGRPGFGEGTIQHPAFAGRIFPQEIVDAARKHLEAAPESGLLGNVNDISRTFGATLDAAAPLIHGTALMVSRPIVWAKATGKMFETLGDPKKYSQFMLKEAAVANDSVRYGLQLGTRDVEIFGATTTKGVTGNILRKIPGFRRASLAFTAFGDFARLHLWGALSPMAFKNGGDKGLFELASFLNNLTGVTSTAQLGIGARQRSIESFTMFASRFARSSAALVADATQGGVRGDLARKQWGRMITGSMLLMYGVGVGVLGMKPEEVTERFDPSKGTFMTLPIGGHNIGPGGSVIQLIRLMGKTYITAIEHPEYLASGSAEFNPVLSWMRGKASPVLGFGMDAAFSRDFLGNEVTVPQALARRVMPFGIQNTPLATSLTGLQEEGSGVGLTASVLGARVFPENRLMKVRDSLADRVYGKKWENLKPTQQASLKRKYPELAQAEREQKADDPASELAVIKARREQARSGDAVKGMLAKDVQAAFKEADAPIGGLARTIGDGYRLNDDQYKEYQALTAKYANQFITRAVRAAQWKKAPDTVKARVLQDLLSSARERARAEILRKAQTQ